MGEARKRGTPQSRAAAARARLPQFAPPAMVCNHCSAALDKVTAMDTRGLEGIQVAFAAHCTPCDRDTWAVRGDIAAVKAFYAALEKASGESVHLGTAKPGAPA